MDACASLRVRTRPGQPVLSASASRRPLPGSERRLASRLSARFWGASGELSKEVTATLAGVDLERPAAEVLESGNGGDRLAERQPVIVIDDSDSFTRRLGSARSRDELIAGFFRPVLRSLTELHAGVVVAVQAEYLEMPTFLQGTTLGIAQAALVAADDRGPSLWKSKTWLVRPSSNSGRNVPQVRVELAAHTVCVNVDTILGEPEDRRQVVGHALDIGGKARSRASIP